MAQKGFLCSCEKHNHKYLLGKTEIYLFIYYLFIYLLFIIYLFIYYLFIYLFIYEIYLCYFHVQMAFLSRFFLPRHGSKCSQPIKFKDSLIRNTLLITEQIDSGYFCICRFASKKLINRASHLGLVWACSELCKIFRRASK